ncbi:PhzF family phenazine biosynthesis protein [Metabacillus sp. GX 13764]|uniref:PhzF family phenazine biosynthesis protein n=1 Tax=Metabacillus kandeliae TaxID=2900151 RepID=UPI001E5B1DC0|nr:PhzF family phenazine biosynthesis isomerase [Metabacillus kandeliae]MCD7035220.1 PhzF family phenazine biosynthesis protein [Metabacillus kandeliae]
MAKTIHTNVFSLRPGGGNPCPVVLEAGGLSQEEKQQMAKAFGHETVFISESRQCDLKLEYFVPLHEMEMCVHATIGAVTVLVNRGEIKKSPVTAETKLGSIRIQWERTATEISVSVEQFQPVFHKEAPGREEVCEALQITSDDLADRPIQSVSVSRPKLIVPLKSEETLHRLNPNFEALWKVCEKYSTTGFYPFAESSGIYHARQFPLKAGYPEDPATGVAAGALGSYLAAGESDGWKRFEIHQGEAMARPSVLFAEVFVEKSVPVRTKVRGSAEES